MSINSSIAVTDSEVTHPQAMLTLNNSNDVFIDACMQTKSFIRSNTNQRNRITLELEMK